MESGIYKITCIANSRIYIGSAKDFKIRWNRHLRDLKSNKHANVHLQRSYEKYGVDSFIFEIIELCSNEDLLIREQYYLDTLKPYEFGFNVGKDASGGDNITFNPNRDDIICRITNTINEKILKMSDEEKKEKWGKLGELNPNYGKKWSHEMRENMSVRMKDIADKGLIFFQINKGKTNIELYGEEKALEISEKLSKYASERIGDKNHFYNKKHSDESKSKMREKQLGIKPPNRVKIEIDGIIYDSYHDASKALNIHITTIRHRCLSKNSKFDNYKLI